MKICYLLPFLPPKLPTAVAELQEIAMLRAALAGDLLYLNPNQHSPLYIPRFLFGFHQWRQLQRQGQEVDIFQFHNPDPFAFPILRCLQKPIVYTISGGIGEQRPNLPFLRQMAAIAVYDKLNLARLQGWGLSNAALIRPGIDVDRFQHHPLPLTGEVRLMMASAPWTTAQFQSKGIEALLAAVKQLPRLRLICLWRGVLGDEMARRIQQAGVGDRVTLINEVVDVNGILATVHASIVLAATPYLVHAYPHSLLDSLAAGKPVLISRAIPMAEYVEETKCGVVVEAVNADAIGQALETLQANYDSLVARACHVGKRDFSQEALVASYQTIYRKLC